MSDSVKERGGLEIISEILSLTRRMISKIDDPDFLVESIEKRELLMGEYDRVKVNPSAQAAIERDKPEIKTIIAEIVELDKKIEKALNVFRNEVKQEVESANMQKRVLGYTNKAISDSGSYLDLKN